MSASEASGAPGVEAAEDDAPAPEREADVRPLAERLADGSPAQVIAFRVGGELHGCDVLLVEEVVTRQRVHPLPDMPPRLLGVLRLRGELVPVLDVSTALGLALERAERPAVLVVGTSGGRIGVAADAVEEVHTVLPDSVRPPPHVAAEREQYVLGVARAGARLLTLIDLAEILRDQTTLSPGERP